MARCMGKTSSGSQCRMVAEAESEFCHHHADQVVEADQATETDDPGAGPEETAVRQVEETPAARASPVWNCPAKGCATQYGGDRKIAQINHLNRVHGLKQ